LQLERLFLPRFHSSYLVRRATLIFADKPFTGTNIRLLQCIRHLLLHRFTFPTTSHIFILTGILRMPSRES